MSIPSITLNTGAPIPQIGLGTWPLTDDEARDAVVAAAEVPGGIVEEIESEIRGPGLGIGAVAGETAIREDRPDVPSVPDDRGIRLHEGIGIKGRGGRGLQRGQSQRCNDNQRRHEELSSRGKEHESIIPV